MKLFKKYKDEIQKHDRMRKNKTTWSKSPFTFYYQ